MKTFILCPNIKKNKQILEWCRPVRPRNSWIQEVKTGMREKGINNMEWIDKEE